MHGESGEILVLGIGNLLWADEGFGVRCIEALNAAWRLPETVQLMDGGTQGLYLLPHVTRARSLIVFDAVDYGLPPGTLRLVEGDEVPRFMGVKKMSLHQTGFQEVLAAAELLGRLPGRMLLIGVQPAELDDYGGSLRPVVRSRVGQAVALAVDHLRRWGVQPLQRTGATPELTAPALAIADYEAQRPSETEAWRHGDPRFLTGPGS